MTTPSSSPDEKSESAEKPPEKVSFFTELKRRKVYRVAITYLIAAWLVIQVAAATFSGFGIPEWAFRFIVLMLVMGFPIALILAWAFELTPDGVKLTRNVSAADQAGISQGKRNWFAYVFAAGMPTVIFGTLAIVFYFNRGEPVVDAGELDKSIAVLPFRNVSDDKSNEYFCDGVQEDILTSLAGISELRVISRTSVMRYKEVTKSIPEIAEELGVSFILEGSVQRFGDRVRVTGQLINAQTDEHLWAKNYDHQVSDIFALQAELSNEIVNSLKLVLTPEEAKTINEVQRVNPVAYELVQKGKYYLPWLPTRLHIERCEALFLSATLMDPEYVDAWILLSYTRVRRLRNTEEDLEKAKNAIDKAAELDPGSAKVLVGLGDYYFYGLDDSDRAKPYYEQALQQSPNNIQALRALGNIAKQLGKWELATQYFKQSYDIDPNSKESLDAYYYQMRGLRNFDRMVELNRRAETLWSGVKGNLYFKHEQEYLMTGNFQPAFDYWEEHADEMKNFAFLYTKCLDAYMCSGNAGKVVEIFEKEGRVDYKERRFWGSLYGIALNLIGRENAARQQLENLENSYLGKSEKEFLDHLYNGFRAAVLGDRDTAMAMLDLSAQVMDKNDANAELQFKTVEYRILVWLGEVDAALDKLEGLLQTPYGLLVNEERKSLLNYPVWDNERFNALMNDPANNAPIKL
ncbi:MAG: tetratricopeptide repeat protein [Puniceicoccaceae bacterium]